MKKMSFKAKIETACTEGRDYKTCITSEGFMLACINCRKSESSITQLPESIGNSEVDK